jgi:hypothetical protein
MPIEFRCTQCDRLLRTGDDAAGKQAICPGCGQVLTVPGAAGGAPPPAGGSPSGTRWAGAGPTGSQASSEPVNPYQSPADFQAAPSWRPAAPLSPVVPTTVSLGDVFSRTWTVFKDQYLTCLGLCLALIGVALLVGMVLMVLMATVMLSARANIGPPMGVAPMAVAPMAVPSAMHMGIMAIVWLPIFLFFTWLQLGVCRGLCSIARGQPTSIGVLFSGGPYWVRGILVSLLLVLVNWGIYFLSMVIAGIVALVAVQGAGPRIMVVQVGGQLLAIIPTVVIALMFSQSLYFVVDRNAGVMESLSLSRQVTSGNKLTLFLAVLLVVLLYIPIALLTCGLGLLFGLAPFAMLLHAMFYLAMSGQTTADQLRYEAWQNPSPMPPAPPPGPPAG